MQRFKAKVEVRNIEMNPTAMVHITFATIDSHNLQTVIIGFAVFPLFVDPDTGMPVTNSNSLVEDDLMDMDRTIHNGLYQLPIYSEVPAENSVVTYEHFLNLEKIPTASVLIRVDFASIDGAGNFSSIMNENPTIAAKAYTKPPEYEEQKYCTTYFLMTP